jgi:hypothetical protein
LLSASRETDLSIPWDFLRAASPKFAQTPEFLGWAQPECRWRDYCDLSGPVPSRFGSWEKKIAMVRRLLAPTVVIAFVIAISQMVTTPEPAALLLLGAALAAAAAGTRRMRHKLRPPPPPAAVQSPSRD